MKSFYRWAFLFLLVGGAVRTIAGRVAMDQFVVDLGGDTLEAGAEAVLFVGPTVGIFEPTDEKAETCVVQIGGDADWIARYLVSLPFRFEVLEPDEVREELRELARRILNEQPVPV